MQSQHLPISTDLPDETLSLRLRRQTARAHKQAERAAGLGAHGIERAAFIRFLERMAGFQAPHERWLARSPIDGEFLSLRRRAGMMAADLAALGQPDGPRSCEEPPGAASLSGAFGVLYVLDGARAGTLHLDRWLSRESWYPSGGLSSMRDPGSERLWLETREALDGLPAAMHEEVIAAAEATFGRLTRWFMEAR